MKTFTSIKSFAVVCSILVAANISSAQMGGSPAGIDSALARLFGDVKAFSSQCETRILDAAQNETMSLVMDFALLDGKIRAEVDMSKMKSKDIPPAVTAQMKQMGMDRVISIMRPDKKMQHIIYPGMKSCVSTAMPKEEAENFEKDLKIEKKGIGKETVDGHPCEKYQVTMTDSQGQIHSSLVWNAEDMKDFPIQIQTSEGGMTTVMKFKQVKLTKPDASQFEAPTDFKKYDSMEAMTAAAVAKMMSGAGQQQK